MLKIIVPGTDSFDEESELFVTVGDTELELEHSLVSLSKWESKWEKPFLGKGEKTSQEINAYIQDMCLTPNVPPEVFAHLSSENLQEINAYLNAKMTATWFNTGPPKPSTEIITAEVVYYWMVALNIPFECQHWHLERLFTLIKVINEKSQPAKKTKVNRSEENARRRALNEQRKIEFETTG